MPNTLTFQRSLPVRHEVDVLVAGGGPAGIAAAMMAGSHTDTRGIEVKILQERLKAMGAFLPNA